MTATTIVNAPSSLPTTRPTRTSRRVGRTGAMAGLTASVATLTFAALARSIDVPLTVSGKAIPVLGFAQLTFIAAIIGTAIAAVCSRRAIRPQRTFVATTLALTCLSFVPDALADAHTATKVALMLSHVVAAAIVIPALASRLSD